MNFKKPTPPWQLCGGINHFQAWINMFVRNHNTEGCQTSLVPPKRNHIPVPKWSCLCPYFSCTDLSFLPLFLKNTEFSPLPQLLLSKQSDSLKAPKEKIPRVTQGIFQSKVIMGTRTFSTLQVSFGQRNFVSKRTEKVKTITRG